MPTSSRNSNQEKAMTIIYDALTYENIGYFYVKEVVVKALLNKSKIIEEIEPHLNKWKFNRLNRLAQAILLLSYAHYYYIQDAEKPVVIDVAIRLSKKYLDDGDYKFINAVLDEVLK